MFYVKAYLGLKKQRDKATIWVRSGFRSESDLVKVLFIEPPKDYWFVMGEYLPPPYGLLQLAAYLESKVADAEIEVLDCQAMSLDWHSLAKRIDAFNPDVVAASGFATCNAYVTARALETCQETETRRRNRYWRAAFHGAGAGEP